MNEQIDQRIHPWLPSQEDINGNPRLFYSDHVPIAATVPLDETGNTLKVISMNIYGGGLCGYQLQPSENPSTLDVERYQRIATKLKDETSNYQVLLLQEVDKISVPIFQEILEPEWQMIPRRDNGMVVSFYRSSDCTLIDGSVHYPEINSRNNIWPLNENLKDSQSFTLKLNNDPQAPLVHLTNLWGQYHDNNEKTFEQRALNIDNILCTPHDRPTVNIVGGDFNISTGEVVSNNPLTITNKPPFSQANKYSCIDAIVYKQPQGRCMQCPVEPVFCNPPEAQAQGVASVDPIGTYKPGLFLQRDIVLSRIEAQIGGLELSTASSFNYLFLHQKQGLNKIEALRELYKRIEGAPIDCNYQNIISQWEKDRPATNHSADYRTIIAQHRNRFWTASTDTESVKAIEGIKNSTKSS